MGSSNPVNIAQMIQDSVLQLCSQYALFKTSLDIDGIVCISPRDEKNQDIIVKMHRTIIKPGSGPQVKHVKRINDQPQMIFLAPANTEQCNNHQPDTPVLVPGTIGVQVKDLNPIDATSKKTWRNIKRHLTEASQETVEQNQNQTDEPPFKKTKPEETIIKTEIDDDAITLDLDIVCQQGSEEYGSNSVNANEEVGCYDSFTGYDVDDDVYDNSTGNIAQGAHEVSRQELRHNWRTKWAISVFEEWLRETRMENTFKHLDAELVKSDDFPLLLPLFYSSVTKKDGGQYSIQSLINLRAALQCAIDSMQEDVDIVKDRKFSAANKALEDVVNYRRKYDISKQRPKIEPEDIRKLYKTVLSNDNPQHLQNKVFFELVLHTGIRGRDTLRELTKSSFRIDKNENGVEYIELVTNEQNKSNSANDKNKKIILATDEPYCPVKSFKLYLEKLQPDCDYFFPAPLKVPNSDRNQKVWFTKVPLGVNSLGNYMKTLSETSQLSKMYTNHCIIATAAAAATPSESSSTGIGKYFIMNCLREPSIKTEMP